MNAFQGSFLSRVRSLQTPARLFMLAILLDGLTFAGYQLFFNLYIVEAGYSRSFLGLLNAAPSISALILGVPMGLLSDRIGRKRAMIIGFTMANCGIIAMILFHSEAAMLAMALLFGVGGQLYMISQAPFMMKASDDRTRDILFSFSYGMFPLASALGNFIAGYLPDSFTNLLDLPTSVSAYKAVVLFSVLSSFLVLLPLAFIREKKVAQLEAKVDETRPKSSIWKVLSRPLTLKLALPNLVIGFGAAILVPYFNVYFSEHYRMSDSSLGTLFSAGALVTGVACLIGPRLVGNLGGKIRTVVIGQSISLVFLLAIGFSPWAWLAVVGFLVRGALMNMVAPLFDAYSLESTHESEHGAVNSIRNLAWNVGWAVGPYLSGLVQQRNGFSPLFISTAVLYAIAILMTWFFFGRKVMSQSGTIPTIELGE
jgi:MFS family permease